MWHAPERLKSIEQASLYLPGIYTGWCTYYHSQSNAMIYLNILDKCEVFVSVERQKKEIGAEIMAG